MKTIEDTTKDMICSRWRRGEMVVDSTHSRFNSIPLGASYTNRSEVLVPFRYKSILITNFAGLYLPCEILRTATRRLWHR